jgi:lipopolysaccharide transport system ATP-binding protein
MSSEHTTPDSSEYAIEVNGLSKCYQIYDKPSDRLKQMLMRGRKQYYKEFWALKDVSFKIKKGETVGIIGRNGSGKSTLLQMICGTLNPTGGEVKVNGRVAALLELGAGFNPEFSGVENVYMAASLYGLSKVEVDQRFDAIAAFAEIGDHIHQPVKTYSSGMYVRLAFAVIAHVDADVLVVDEALAVGDAFFTQKCMRFLRNFMKEGTVIFVSHDTASVKNLCNYAIWLEKGEMQEEGSPKEICERYLEAFYESMQGKSSVVRLKKIKSSENKIISKDSRLKYINSSNLRNDIKVFEFDPDAHSFGKGGAEIADIKLLNEEGNSLSWIIGGEYVRLRVLVDIHKIIYSPIVGFFIKDKLGQTLFGDNTYLAYENNPQKSDEGNQLQADFCFLMPILPAGNYSITVAIADGTQEIHEQLQWIHDAIIFKSESSSVSTGLIGIPMQEIKIEIMNYHDK